MVIISIIINILLLLLLHTTTTIIIIYHLLQIKINTEDSNGSSCSTNKTKVFLL